ncbi:8815_t:CDS:2 [Entrophospora sp. SA101]|nr:13038_t:CDS:2 [Entrophospora sp. SA101]CAJ0764621.1 8815_t:CDS:2 [Entrophospora sp. SA101]CAJ0915042.1 18791_t:CDS:2 [Entrophospora sp. SA101]
MILTKNVIPGFDNHPQINEVYAKKEVNGNDQHEIINSNKGQFPRTVEWQIALEEEWGKLNLIFLFKLVNGVFKIVIETKSGMLNINASIK